MTAADSLPSSRLAGDSLEQREAEPLILARLSDLVGTPLVPHVFARGGGIRLTVDGYSSSPPVLAEIWAHQGPPKPAQKAKVITDALKLLWLDKVEFGGAARKILALADTAAARHFRATTTWIGGALPDLGIEVVVVDLPDDLRARILAAQVRQFR